MPRTADEQTVAEDMYRYFNREWRDKIQAALRQLPRTDTAQNTIANLLVDAYLCGVRDGQGFGMESLAREAERNAPLEPLLTTHQGRVIDARDNIPVTIDGGQENGQ